MPHQLFHSMKAFLGKLEVGVRCEGEMTPRGENTEKRSERVFAWARFLQHQHPVHFSGSDLFLFRSEMESGPQPPTKTAASGVERKHRIRTDPHIDSGKHLHTCALSCAFSNFHKRTHRLKCTNSGTSPYTQFPLSQLHSPLKHCLFILYEKKTTLSFCTHTHTHTRKTGDFQPLRNSSVIAGALLSIKTWPFQHVCAVLGAVGTGEEEERGLPCSVVVWPKPPLLSPSRLPPKKITELPPRPRVRHVRKLGGEDTANPQIRSKGITGRCGKGGGEVGRAALSLEEKSKSLDITVAQM